MPPHATKKLVPRLEKGGVMLPAITNPEFITDTKDVFFYVDPEFDEMKDTEENGEIEAMGVTAYETGDIMRFVEMFTANSCDLDTLCLTQSQIVELVKLHKSWLKGKKMISNMLFRDKEQYWIATVLVDVENVANITVDPLGARRPQERGVQVVVPVHH